MDDLDRARLRAVAAFVARGEEARSAAALQL